MRGFEQQSDALFVYVSPESFVPNDHPLRPIRQMVDTALENMSPVFSQMYSHTGRPSIPPERLLKAMLLQVLYSIPSNVKLVEQIHFSILFRWFLGLGLDEPVWDNSSFTTNQERLIETDVAARFLAEVLEQAKRSKLLSKDHFSVDGTLIQAWASLKSFKPRDDQEPPAGKNSSRDFKGEKLSNDTHSSTTDPEAKLYRKGLNQEPRLSFAAHLLTENLNGLVVMSRVTEADGFAERETAKAMIGKIAPRKRRVTVAADKNYDTFGFAKAMRELNVTPHVTQNTTKKGRRSSIDGRTTRHSSYAASQKFRKRIEEVFGWLKTVGLFRKTRYQGVKKIDWHFTLAVTAYNLVRMRNLGVCAT